MYRRFIANKYLFSRITTFMALLVVACGVALLIIIMSVMEGFRSELISRIRGISSDIKVTSTRYIDLRDPDRVAAVIASVPGVRATAPFVEAPVLYRSVLDGEDFRQRFLRVVDVERELQVGDLAAYVANVAVAGIPDDPKILFSKQWNETELWRKLGRPPPYPPGGFPPPVLLGKEAWRRELVLPGSVVEIVAYSPATQQPCSQRFQVAGFFKTGLYELDSRGIVMERRVARGFLGLSAPDGTELASGIRVAAAPGHESGERLQELRGAVEEALERAAVPFVRTMTWRQEQASLLRQVLVEKTLIGLILGMIVLFVGFMIFIVLTVQVVEKTRDIGVLQSMGASSRGLASVYFTIGLVLSLTGTVMGTAYGVSFSLGVNTVQRWITLLTGLVVFPPNVYYLDHIPVRFNPGDLTTIIVPTVVAGVLASIVPAYRAARKTPVAALRHE